MTDTVRLGTSPCYLENVADGEDDYDAVNVRQLRSSGGGTHYYAILQFADDELIKSHGVTILEDFDVIVEGSSGEENRWDWRDGTFTPDIPGVYMITATVGFDSGSVIDGSLQYYVDGNIVAEGPRFEVNTPDRDVHVTMASLVNLESGDDFSVGVDISGYGVSAGGTVLAGVSTQITIHLVAGG